MTELQTVDESASQLLYYAINSEQFFISCHLREDNGSLVACGYRVQGQDVISKWHICVRPKITTLGKKCVGQSLVIC